MKTRLHHLGWPVLLGCAAMIRVAGAGAQPVAPADPQAAEAERLFEEGVAAAERGEYEAALRMFEASYETNPLPDVLFNIGMCHKALGNLPAALNTFRRYVAEMGDALTAEGRAEYGALEAELVPQVGRLSVEVSEAGAAVAIDREPIGTSPLGGWVAVAPGAHMVGATMEGFEAATASTDAVAGEIVAVTLRLDPVEAAVVVPETPPVVPPVEGESSTGLSPWFWVSVGVAGAAAVGMSVTGGLALSYKDDYAATDYTDRGLYDTAFALRTTTDVLLGVALAAAVAGTVLLFLPEEEEGGEPAPDAGLALAPSGLVGWW